ncbi:MULTISPECIES: carbohydrate-binding protein [unclassified Streptomyces]|uniref:carbohydrate-binding protein n=1 Tax=unclassified Streptomyces TaxID=2593676 RepID=UPI0004C0F10F|nr:MULTISPECIES: carbohydrate-binding protein [unclassified Streptomyces]
MARRHVGAGCAVLTVLGSLVLANPSQATATASSVPPADGPSAARTLGADRPSAEVLHALRRDLGLTAAQARQRLTNEAEAGTRAGRLHNALGTRFAGAWVHGKTSAGLTVATTNKADVAAIEAGGADAKVVKVALADLRTVKTKLDRAAAATKGRRTPVRYVDIRNNRVTVQATSKAAADALVKAARVDRTRVAVKVSKDQPRALYDITGGDAYYINDEARCSVGFSVTKGEQQGFVSAGHCGGKGDTTTGYNQVAQGTFQDSVFPGHDYSWVAANDDWTATPHVKGEGGADVTVSGSVEALVGASVCRSGSTTGWHCGTIEEHDTSVTYPEGTVDGVTRTTVCAEPGDSGGPYLSGSQAQGVTSGGSGDCTSGGTTYYQPVNPALSAFGLTLTTDTATTETPGTTPEPESGTWAAGAVYDVGAKVTYGGVTYVCLQPHQAQGAWQPATTPALWQKV